MGLSWVQTPLTQGQATSGQLYSLGIQPLNRVISTVAHQHPGAFLAAYIDDIKTQTSVVLMEKIIDIQISDGPAYGTEFGIRDIVFVHGIRDIVPKK